MMLCSAFAAPMAPAAGAEAGSQFVVASYADALGTANPGLPASARHELAERLLLLSSYYRLDARLLAALVTVESAWHVRATSSSGALGLGQLMPATAATLDVDAHEPYENLDGTARYLRRLLARYAGRDALTQMRLAIASYNAGPDVVARFGAVPPYRETRLYVAAVIAQWRRLALTLSLPPAGAWEELGSPTRVALAPPAAPSVAGARIRGRMPKAHHNTHVAARKRRHAGMKRRGPLPSRYVIAMEPNVAVETPAPVRWETSHSLVARLLGLRHRVTIAVGPASPAVAASTALRR